MKTSTALILTAVSLSLISPAFAAENAHLRQSGQTQGDANHDKWIDVLSVSGLPSEKGTTRPQGATGATRGRMKTGDLTLTRRIDKASPMLLESLNSGSEIEEMTVSQGAVSYKLSQVKIASIKQNKDTEVITLHCVSVTPVTTKAATATDYNSSRSNRTTRASSAAPAQDYNSSRSNKGG